MKNFICRVLWDFFSQGRKDKTMDGKRTIAIMTSGGDAPGMNAAVRAVTKAAIYKGYKVIGINNGFKGLVEADMVELGLMEVENIMHLGGTVLGTARLPEFKLPETQDKAVDILKTYGITDMVVIGGDGTFTGAQKLSHKCEEPKHNYKCNLICLPGTIDNDLACTDFTIGFDTALNTVVDAVDKIKDTMSSHGRCCVVEIMGNRCGDLSLFSSINTGAESLILAEKPESFDVDKVCEAVNEGVAKGRKCHIVILSELITDAAALSKTIEQRTGVSTRPSILGYIQRGGRPTAYDRMLATKMGVYAVDLLEKGETNQVVSIRENKIVNDDIDVALAMPRVFDEKLYEMNKILSI